MNIIFAAIAIFILFKLKQQFGKINHDQKRDVIKKFVKEKANNFSDLGSKSNRTNASAEPTDPMAPTSDHKPSREELAELADNEESAKIMSSLSEDLQKELIDILRICQISVVSFINILNKMLEDVVSGFSSGKKEDMLKIRDSLSGRIYQQFENLIEKRHVEKKILVSKIIAIDSTNIMSASMDDGMAAIVVKFITRQINYVTDEQNNIIEGRKDLITVVTDCWTFKRDFTLKKPFWFISSTNS
jgi:predicted lipid-binding transport protein (Tim44 family)